MITREQIENAFEDKFPFKNKNIDHHFIAISLLREKIPYEVCRSIIGGAEHDVLYLCDLDKAMEYLTPEDLDVLADCNVFVDNDYFALFV